MFSSIACRAGNFVNADANHRLRAAATLPYRLTGISLISAYFWRRRSGAASGNSYAQAGTCPERAVEKDSAAHCLRSVLEADKAGAAVEVGTADAVVAYGDVEVRRCRRCRLRR